ncbi:hypothetical protein E3N88_19250 [Mikania micrantha]|uniref:Uncharacterized protein n=1 Tax=Mikania micrantha TaxID=192012 RepID=A0A5N6NN68_9ASTR|nr:hypothetical protein E3N88_19250 [Mikania micrantha]
MSNQAPISGETLASSIVASVLQKTSSCSDGGTGGSWRHWRNIATRISTERHHSRKRWWSSFIVLGLLGSGPDLSSCTLVRSSDLSCYRSNTERIPVATVVYGGTAGDDLAVNSGALPKAATVATPWLSPPPVTPTWNNQCIGAPIKGLKLLSSCFRCG